MSLGPFFSDFKGSILIKSFKNIEFALLTNIINFRFFCQVHYCVTQNKFCNVAKTGSNFSHKHHKQGIFVDNNRKLESVRECSTFFHLAHREQRALLHKRRHIMHASNKVLIRSPN